MGVEGQFSLYKCARVRVFAFSVFVWRSFVCTVQEEENKTVECGEGERRGG